jgi:hypothetical protein
LYNGSNIKLKEFCVSFLLKATADRISRKTLDKFLGLSILVLSILPAENNVPCNFNRLIKRIEPDENTITTARKICSRPSKEDICNTQECQSDKNKKTMIEKYI